MRKRLTSEQMRALPKEQLIHHAIAVQEELDKAAARARQFGQALERMGYFANPSSADAPHNQEVPHA